MVQFNGLNEQALEMLTKEETPAEAKAAILMSALPVLKKLEKIDKLADSGTEPKIYKGNGNGRGGYGGAVKPLTPAEKFDSLKGLFTGIETEKIDTLPKMAKYISGLDAKQKDSINSLIGAICQ